MRNGLILLIAINVKNFITFKHEKIHQTTKRIHLEPDLELAFQGINKKFGEGALMRLGDATKMNVSVISTGSLAIDLPGEAVFQGRIVEIYGPEYL